MSQVSTYQFGLVNLRVVELDGQPWFVARDVCAALGYAVTANGVNVTKAVNSLHPNEVKRLPRATLWLGRGGIPIPAISESGLYKLVMRSDKPQARAFQDWVTRVVLPAIRKDGAYVMSEEKVATGEMDEDELVMKALGILQKKVERLKDEKLKLQKDVQHLTYFNGALEASNAALQHKVDHLTVRQYERELGRYLHKAERNLLSHYAKGYCLLNDLPIGKAPMQFNDKDSYANVYPRKALEHAAGALGVAA